MYLLTAGLALKPVFVSNNQQKEMKCSNTTACMKMFGETFRENLPTHRPTHPKALKGSAHVRSQNPSVSLSVYMPTLKVSLFTADAPVHHVIGEMRG